MADNTQAAPPRKAAPAKTPPRKAPPRKAPPRKVAPPKAAPQKSAGAPTKAPATLHVSGRAAARKVEEAGHMKLRLPLVGAVRLPEPQQLGYFAAIGASWASWASWSGPSPWCSPALTSWHQISATGWCSSSGRHSKTSEPLLTRWSTQYGCDAVMPSR